MYLNTWILSRQKLFKDYLATRNWRKYYKSLIDNLVSLDDKKNSTRLSDVPRICRIKEGRI